MGLFTFAIEAIVLSSGMASVRQFFNYSVRDYVLPKITHPLTNKIVEGYFETGEYIVNSTVNFYNKKTKKD